MQSKLDRIDHERRVLALLRQLAEQGLCEGDRVKQASTGAAGQVQVLREEAEPRAVVTLPGGSQVPFDRSWRRA
ncbi:MAG: hypothetical protein ACM3PU_02430 [Gemmatimonadota bacterium]